MDKYNLCWNDFENSAGATIKTLWSDTAYTDVTLVTDDEKQILAHKVIIGSSSSFFRKILLGNPNKHMFIYLKGIGYNELTSILRFMYLGQTEVGQESLDKFMNAAQELKIRGLHEKVEKVNYQTPYRVESVNQDVQKKEEVAKDKCNDKSGTEMSCEVLYVVDKEKCLEEDVEDDKRLVTNDFTRDPDVEIKKYSCTHCAYQTNYPHDLRRHRQIKHEGFKPFKCDICEYRAVQTSDVKKHKLRKHPYIALN